MKYLLDVNALIALGFREHEFHTRISMWLSRPESPQLATCSITELGFMRVLTSVSPYAIGINDARAILAALKTSNPPRFEFVSDTVDALALPGWVSGPRQITDGHLVNLATANQMRLATLDTRIPGAYVIP